jgi:hypothetical protein
MPCSTTPRRVRQRQSTSCAFLRLCPPRSIGTRALRPRGGRLRLTCAVGFGGGYHPSEISLPPLSRTVKLELFPVFRLRAVSKSGARNGAFGERTELPGSLRSLSLARRPCSGLP